MTSGIDETISVSDLRSRLKEIIEACALGGRRFTIARNSEIEAVLVGAAEWNMLNETLEVLADQRILAQIEASQRDIEHRRVRPADEVLSEITAQGEESDNAPAE